jgi:hypothetical protein
MRRSNPMEIVHFFKLANGASFVVDGEVFTKLEGLVYRDAFGLEHYIDPLFDVKLGKVLAEEAAKVAPQVDTSATIVKDTENQ